MREPGCGRRRPVAAVKPGAPPRGPGAGGLGRYVGVGKLTARVGRVGAAGGRRVAGLPAALTGVKRALAIWPACRGGLS